MDELTLLTQHRPDAPPPTDDERAAARDAVMAHVVTAPGAERTGTVVDLAASPRRNRRRLGRAVALVGAAAAFAAAALAVGTTGNGPGPLRAEPSAAEALVAIAEVVEEGGVYPAGAYAVPSHQESTSVGGGIDDVSTSIDVTLYRVNDSDIVARCEDDEPCFPRVTSSATNDLIPHEGTPTEVRAGVEAQLDAYAGAFPTGSELAWARLTLISQELANPALSPGVRAELLRIVAESADLSIEEDVETALGLTGTRFVASTPTGVLELIIDPADGYVLEVSEEGTTKVWTVDVDEEGQPVTSEGEMAETSSVLSYARPVAADPLPTDVQDLADDLATVSPQIEATYPDGGCAGVTGGSPGGSGSNWGLDVPPGLSAVHCWLP
jgi:hypothetical protein